MLCFVLCFEFCDVLKLMYMYIVYVYMRYTIYNILCIREANSDIRTMTRCGVGNKVSIFIHQGLLQQVWLFGT